MSRRRARPHVFKERGEGLPPRTDRNPAAAITRIVGALWILAALEHTGPAVVGRVVGSSILATTRATCIPPNRSDVRDALRITLTLDAPQAVAVARPTGKFDD